MSGPALSMLVRRASEWLVQPEHPHTASPASAPPSPRTHPLVAVVGLARGCGSTTVARALATELASREGGAAVLASPERPAVVGLGRSSVAARLAERLDGLEHVRVVGRLCLARVREPVGVAALVRAVAPAVLEVEPGSAAVDVAPVVDRVVLVAPPALEPALIAAVAETIAAAGRPPVVALNRAGVSPSTLLTADVTVPESRIGALMAGAGHESRGSFRLAIEQLADLCAA